MRKTPAIAATLVLAATGLAVSADVVDAQQKQTNPAFDHFGYHWTRVPKAVAAALHRDHPNMNFTYCAWRVGNTTVVVCPNGFTAQS